MHPAYAWRMDNQPSPHIRPWYSIHTSPHGVPTAYGPQPSLLYSQIGGTIEACSKIPPGLAHEISQWRIDRVRESASNLRNRGRRIRRALEALGLTLVVRRARDWVWIRESIPSDTDGRPEPRAYLESREKTFLSGEDQRTPNPPATSARATAEAILARHHSGDGPLSRDSALDAIQEALAFLDDIPF